MVFVNIVAKKGNCCRPITTWSLVGAGFIAIGYILKLIFLSFLQCTAWYNLFDTFEFFSNSFSD